MTECMTSTPNCFGTAAAAAAAVPFSMHEMQEDDWEQTACEFVTSMESQKRDLEEKKQKEEKKAAKREKQRIKEEMQKQKEVVAKYTAELKDAQLSLELLLKPDDGVRIDMSSQWSSSCNMDDVIREQNQYSRTTKRMLEQSSWRRREHEKKQKEKKAKEEAKKKKLEHEIARLTGLLRDATVDVNVSVPPCK